MGESYDVFLVLHPLGSIPAQNRARLKPLEPLECLLGVDTYYDQDTDTAVLGLRFAAQSLERLGAYTVHLYCSRSGLPMVVPARLSPGERRRFFMEQLGRYGVYVQQYPAKDDPAPLVVRALDTLISHVAALPRPTQQRSIDLSREFPLFNPRRGVARRASTAG